MSDRLDHSPRDGVLASTDAGTPFALPGDAVDEALLALELSETLALVAGMTAGPCGAQRVLSRRPSSDVAWVRGELDRVGEAVALGREGRGISAEPVPDVKEALAQLRVAGSVLDGAALIAFRRVLEAGRRIAGELRRVAPEAPRVAELLRPLPEGGLERRLTQALDGDGRLLDTASPALAAARGDVRSARARLIQRLETILRKLESGTEAGVTVRNGRYVIPVPRDARNRPDGIVHDESASGSTLFLEPSQAIELGNALRAAEARAEREELRLYRELTDLLRPRADELSGAFEMCVEVDDVAARARWAQATEGHLPEVAPAGTPLAIVSGRHPLLLAQGGAVVPFDLQLEPGERTILLSGPNTGGKTVLLKAVGLIAALSQSGIVPPVGRGTRLPVFRRFFADIGDRQSISANLSTFSAHVALLKRVLEEADGTTLVLLDEIGSGTDPAEGAALAAAALLSLTRRGTLTIATTHLGTLKELAAQFSGIVNASLEFDGRTLRPTYRLQKGVPGRSYGLAIARRLGVPEDVLASAEAHIPSGEKTLDALLAAAEQRSQALSAREAALSERAIDLDMLQARLSRQTGEQESRETELDRRERESERGAREQARAYLLEARRRVEQAIGQARAAVDEVTAREARRLVEEGIKAEAEALGRAGSDSGHGEPRERAIGTGTRVRLASGQTGSVVDVRSDGKLVVMIGTVRLVVDPGQAVAVEAPVAPSRIPGPGHSTAGDVVAVGAPMEIDLRGLTADEAEAAVIAALDGAILAEHPLLRIIHGKGTGALRDRVRRVLSADRRIAKFDFAPSNQGGTGVTVVELGS